MARRIHHRLASALALLVTIPAAAGCRDRQASPDPEASATVTPAPRPGTPQPPTAPAEPAAPDAATAPQPEPVKPEDVLSGAEAERAIGELKSAAPTTPEPAAPVPDGVAELEIRTDGLGPYELGKTRAELAALLTGKGSLKRFRGPGGAEPSLDIGQVDGPRGAPLARLRVVAGRLAEIEVLTRDPRTLTSEGIGVGSTIGEAIDAHGDARALRDTREGRATGWVMSDLPGVVFVPGGAMPREGQPNPATRVWRVVIVGPEETGDAD